MGRTQSRSLWGGEPLSQSLLGSPTFLSQRYLLIGGAEDEEGASLWNGHCFLLQLQLGQGAWPGAYWDLRLIFLIIACGERE